MDDNSTAFGRTTFSRSSGPLVAATVAKLRAAPMERPLPRLVYQMTTGLWIRGLRMRTEFCLILRTIPVSVDGVGRRVRAMVVIGSSSRTAVARLATPSRTGLMPLRGAYVG